MHNRTICDITQAIPVQLTPTFGITSFTSLCLPKTYIHINVMLPFRFLKFIDKFLYTDDINEFYEKFSFVWVRDPWRRLVSAYIQKFVDTNQGATLCRFSTRFPELHRRYM